MGMVFLEFKMLQNIILKSVNEVLSKNNINIEFIVVNKNNRKNQLENDNYIYFSDFYDEKDIVINKLKKFNNFDFTVQTDEVTATDPPSGGDNTPTNISSWIKNSVMLFIFTLLF